MLTAVLAAQAPTLAPVLPLRPNSPDDLARLIAEFCERYDNPKTAGDYRRTLTQLFRTTGRRHPAELTETDLLKFCTSGSPANNTVFQRSAKVRTFTRWCTRTGAIGQDPAQHLRDSDSPLRSYPRTYGKVQARNPGRWLDHDEAYGRLVGACQDGTTLGLRDEIAIRLGLAGMRLAEIASLRLDNLRQVPTITWTGKGHKPRQATAGKGLCDAVARYLEQYPDHSPNSPLLCCQVLGTRRQGGASRLNWGHPIGTRTLFYAINRRGIAAGLSVAMKKSPHVAKSMSPRVAK